MQSNQLNSNPVPGEHADPPATQEAAAWTAERRELLKRAGKLAAFTGPALYVLFGTPNRAYAGS